MLAPAYESNPVQAFPISKLTVRGTLTDQTTVNRSTLRALAAGDVTYTFQDDTTYVESLVVGDDRGLTRDVKSVTSTMECMVS